MAAAVTTNFHEVRRKWYRRDLVLALEYFLGVKTRKAFDAMPQRFKEKVIVAEMRQIDEALRWFDKYEKVRTSGRYNMLETRAQSAVGLPRSKYLFVMANYSMLVEAAKRMRGE